VLTLTPFLFKEARFVIIEGLDLDRPPSPSTRRQKPMPVRIRAGPDVLDRGTLRQFGATDHKRHHAASVQQDEPANRTREHQVALVVVEIGVPAHLLRECHASKQPAHDVGKNVDGRLSTLVHAVGQIGSLWRFLAFERRDVDAVLFREPGSRRRRFTIGFERRGHRRSRDELFEVRLTLGELDDPRSQSPRRAVRFGGRIGLQPQLLQTGIQLLAELPRQSRQPAGWNFLTADFDQEFAVHRLGPFPRWCAAEAGHVTIRRGWRNVRLCNLHGKLPHTQDVRRALGHADAAAGVENIEQM